MKWMGRAVCLVTLAIAPAARAAWPIAPGASLVEVYSGSGFYEGPSWDPVTNFLYFTDLAGGALVSKIFRLNAPHDVSLWMNNTQGINGTFLGMGNRLLAAQGGARKILSMHIGANGPEDVQVLAANSQWHPPNDLCQTYAGNIYFTTPDFTNRLSSRIFRLSPFADVTLVSSDMTLPNGIIASNDGQTLYVSDSWQKWWRSYPILPDGSLGPGSLFFNPATSNMNDPDGMTIDAVGNLYFTGRGGVWIVSPEGELIEMISMPEATTNATFGGADGKTLYITCSGKVYSLAMQVRGGFWLRYPDPNQAPVVDAGADRAVFARRTVTFAGSVSDDGLPVPPGALSVRWSVTMGASGAELASPESLTTDAVFEVGIYLLRLAAYDGSRTSFDEVLVTAWILGDLTHNGSVDGTDLTVFTACMSGPDHAPEPSCIESDLDQDNDVDQSDFALLQRCLGAPLFAGLDCAG